MPSLTKVNCKPIKPTIWQQLFETVAWGALPEWDQLARRIELKELPAGSTVFAQNTAHSHLYAVREGLVKLSYIDENGNEWIKSFASEGQFLPA